METIINQIIDIENKCNLIDNISIERNIKRLYHEFETLGYKIINPINQPYKSTDTSIDATLADNISDNPIIKKVLKPVIYKTTNGEHQLIQKGIVIVAKIQHFIYGIY